MSKRSMYQPSWFSQRLMEGLYRSGLSITEVAERSGMSRSHAYQIFVDRRMPSLALSWKIAGALGISLDPPQR